jgi:hypothetical protein
LVLWYKLLVRLCKFFYSHYSTLRQVVQHEACKLLVIFIYY